MDDIAALHLDNPSIRARYLPLLDTPGKLEATTKHPCAFLEAGSGGPDAYRGRNMRDTHRGMNVSDAEYIAAIDDILAALRKNEIDANAERRAGGRLRPQRRNPALVRLRDDTRWF